MTEQKVDFSSFGNLLQINGINNDTGGGSGAAKSSMFHAHDYLLGINDIPASSLQSRLTKSPMMVEATYTVNDTPLIVRRSKKDGLYLKFGDEEFSGNIALAEEKLWEIIGIHKKII